MSFLQGSVTVFTSPTPGQAPPQEKSANTKQTPVFGGLLVSAFFFVLLVLLYFDFCLCVCVFVFFLKESTQNWWVGRYEVPKGVKEGKT